MIANLKRIYLYFKRYATLVFGFLWELLSLFKFVLEGKRSKRFLESSVNAEIKTLKKSNKKYREYQYSPYHYVIDIIENHKIKATAAIFFLLIGSYFFSKRFNWYFEKTQLADISEFEQFAATIQVTLFAVVVPFSTAIFEFVFKDYQSKIDLIRLVHKETKVLFLTVSSIILTITLFLGEYLTNVFGIYTNVVAVSVTTLWLAINTIGMGYFIITGLKFLTPYYRYRALTKYVANEVYPNELKNYIRRNAYLNLGTLNEEGKNE